MLVMHYLININLEMKLSSNTHKYNYISTIYI